MKLVPVVTEKSFAMSEKHQYVFHSITPTNKIEVAKYIDQTYKVKVTSVRVVNLPAKSKKFKSRAYSASRKTKYIVSLMPGQKIDLYEVENAN
jgi:large subunit ribosomal protein L23